MKSLHESSGHSNLWIALAVLRKLLVKATIWNSAEGSGTFCITICTMHVWGASTAQLDTLHLWNEIFPPRFSWIGSSNGAFLPAPSSNQSRPDSVQLSALAAHTAQFMMPDLQNKGEGKTKGRKTGSKRETRKNQLLDHFSTTLAIVFRSLLCLFVKLNVSNSLHFKALIYLSWGHHILHQDAANYIICSWTSYTTFILKSLVPPIYYLTNNSFAMRLY